MLLYSLRTDILFKDALFKFVKDDIDSYYLVDVQVYNKGSANRVWGIFDNSKAYMESPEKPEKKKIRPTSSPERLQRYRESKKKNVLKVEPLDFVVDYKYWSILSFTTLFFSIFVFTLIINTPVSKRFKSCEYQCKKICLTWFLWKLGPILLPPCSYFWMGSFLSWNCRCQWFSMARIDTFPSTRSEFQVCSCFQGVLGLPFGSTLCRGVPMFALTQEHWTTWCWVSKGIWFWRGPWGAFSHTLHTHFYSF